MATISLPGQISRTRRFSLGVPDQFTTGRNGTLVLFRRRLLQRHLDVDCAAARG